MKKIFAGLMTGAAAAAMAAGMAFSAQAVQIDLGQAKKTALEAAGLTEDEVIFKKAGTDFDDGKIIEKDIDFDDLD